MPQRDPGYDRKSRGHQYAIGPIDDPMCRFCGDSESQETGRCLKVWGYRREKIGTFFAVAGIATVWNSLVFWVLAMIGVGIASWVNGHWSFDWGLIGPLWACLIALGYVQLLKDEVT